MENEVISDNKDDALIKKIIGQKEYFSITSQNKRKIWADCYQSYNSKFDETANPFLSNLFIPKIHEAVELLAAFLAGKNQSISVSAEGKGDLKKAQICQKLLDFQWRKVLYAQDKIVKWVKQGILFGNGFMKVGWDMDDDTDEPFMQVIGVDQIYTDYFTEDIQQAPLIHRVVKSLSEVKEDKRYNNKRKDLIDIEDDKIEDEKTIFNTSDDTQNSSTNFMNRTEILEYWTRDNKEVITLGNTKTGWQILRRMDNKNKDNGKLFKPFVKLKFKTSPLPNRAYDMGAIEPSLPIQAAFNEAIRAFLDNAMLINQKGWIVRRGAKINPTDMVRKPGFQIKVDDINADIKSEEVGDIKQSMMEMISFLDNEFQQSSMVINLLKGMGNADTATEAALGQQNVQTQIDLVDSNIKAGLSKLGQMIVAININNINKVQSIKVLENDNEIGFIDIDPKAIKGRFDVKVSADRPPAESKAVRQKQLLDFLAIVGQDMMTMQKYPDLTEKIYKEWLREGGFSDIDYFFTKTNNPLPPPMPGGQGGQLNRNAGMTSGAIQKSAMNPAVNPQSNK